MEFKVNLTIVTNPDIKDASELLDYLKTSLTPRVALTAYGVEISRDGISIDDLGMTHRETDWTGH